MLLFSGGFDGYRSGYYGGGFAGVLGLRSDDDPTVGAPVLVCDTRESAAAAHEASLAIMRERRPQSPVRVAASGMTSVLAVA